MKKKIKGSQYNKKKRMEDKISDLYSYVARENGKANARLDRNTETRNFVRNTALIEWKKIYLAKYKYKCNVSGYTKDLEVHHLNKPFHVLYQEALINLKLTDYRYAMDYSEDQLRALAKEIQRLHRYVRGVVMTSVLHNEFHAIYGADGDKYAYYEFRQKWRQENLTG